MISTETSSAIVSDLMDELPEAFFWELTGGVILSEAVAMPDYARGNDLAGPVPGLLWRAADRDVQGLL